MSNQRIIDAWRETYQNGGLMNCITSVANRLKLSEVEVWDVIHNLPSVCEMPLPPEWGDTPVAWYTVEYRYSIELLPTRRHRNTKTFTPDHGRYSIPIRTVAPQDIPVAAEIELERYALRYRENRENGYENVPVVLRWYDDRLWTDYTDLCWGNRAEEFRKFEAVDTVLHNSVTSDYSSYNKRSITEIQQRLRTAAHHMVVVDGRLWKALDGEPVFIVNDRDRSGKIGIEVNWPNLATWTYNFNLNDLDQALKFAGPRTPLQAEAREAIGMKIVVRDTAIVHIPEAFAFKRQPNSRIKHQVDNEHVRCPNCGKLLNYTCEIRAIHVGFNRENGTWEMCGSYYTDEIPTGIGECFCDWSGCESQPRGDATGWRVSFPYDDHCQPLFTRIEEG